MYNFWLFFVFTLDIAVRKALIRSIRLNHTWEATWYVSSRRSKLWLNVPGLVWTDLISDSDRTLYILHQQTKQIFVRVGAVLGCEEFSSAVHVSVVSCIICFMFRFSVRILLLSREIFHHLDCLLNTIPLKSMCEVVTTLF